MIAMKVEAIHGIFDAGHNDEGACQHKDQRRELAGTHDDTGGNSLRMGEEGLHRVTQDSSAESGLSTLPEDIYRLSMLSPRVLERIAEWARLGSGPVVEVGPYVGGSTIAVATGVGTTDRPIITIEAGGSHMHPTLPSADILSDLHANLRRFGVDQRVHVIPKFAHLAYPDVSTLLEGRPADLLLIDADGFVQYHMSRLRSMIEPRCALVFDDYLDANKGPRVRGFVDRAVRDGALVAKDLVDGTWFGGVAGDLSYFADCPRFWHDQGASWLSFLDVECPSDDLGSPIASLLAVFEGDQRLGPPHTLHQEIREVGLGRYSHWRGWLYFSTSDNTDPNANGRRYSVQVDRQLIRL